MSAAATGRQGLGPARRGGVAGLRPLLSSLVALGVATATSEALALPPPPPELLQERPAPPQVTVAVTTGVAFHELARPSGMTAVFPLGLRASSLFLRRRDRDMGIGPYLDVSTIAFDSLELGAGADWLVPAGSEVTFVFGAGGHLRWSALGVEPAVAGRVFFGSRSLNYHSWYGLSAGLFAEGRLGVAPASGAPRQADVLVGAQVDTMFVALPFLLLFNALR